MKNPFKRVTALLITIVLLMYIFIPFACAVDVPIAVSVSVIRDNITLAEYEVSVQDMAVRLSELGGERAVFEEGANGDIVKITINGQELEADQKHEIIVLHNGREISGGQVSVNQSDEFVFKYLTIAESSASVSSKIPSRPAIVSSEPNPVIKPKPDKTSSKTVSSKKTVNSSDMNSETSSKNSSVGESSRVSSITSSGNSIRVNPNKYKWDDKLAQALENACVWLNINSKSVMQFVALSSAGKPAKASDVEKFLQGIKASGGEYQTVRELAEIVISCAFCGVSAENVRGIDLVQKLIDMNLNKNPPVSAASLMLIALDSDFYAHNDVDIRGRTVKYILSLQNADGGFGSKNRPSDVQTTAMALTALSNYKKTAASEIARGISYLSDKFAENGYRDNSVSISKVIIALNTLGFSMDDKRFVFEGKNLIRVLLEHMNIDGGFVTEKEDVSDATATEYAVLALVSVKNGLSPYVINYQSQKLEAVQAKPEENTHNFYLFVILGGMFCAVITMTVTGFVYFKKIRSVNDRSNITYLFK